jgi:hypothetical protein
MSPSFLIAANELARAIEKAFIRGHLRPSA